MNSEEILQALRSGQISIEEAKKALQPHTQTPAKMQTAWSAQALERELARSLAKALYLEESDIDVERAFGQMGLDSVIGIEWIRSLNEQYAMNLAATRIYDHPSIRQMARFLEKELRKQQSEGLPGQGQAAALMRVEETPLVGTGVSSPITRVLHRETPVRADPSRPSGHDDNLTSKYLPTRGDSASYRHVVVKRSGGIDDLLTADAEMLELGEHEVRVAVRAFSLNFGDLLCVKGLYPTMPPYPFTPGFDASGVVLEVGPAVTACQIGDPVIALAGPLLGGQASVMTCPEEHVFHKPAILSFEEATALPVAALTMVAAFAKACLKRGEKILIQTATGGTGLIAIQLARYYGAHIYATAGSQAKLDYLEQLGVPYRINYRETDFEQEIERLTEGKGVDVVINTLPGDAIQKGMNCLSPGGRYIEIAMTALKSARTIDLSVFSQNQTLYSVDLRELALTHPTALKRYGREMLQLAEKGIITPTICQVFSWERLKEAYRYMEDRQHIGKIVVRIPEEMQAGRNSNDLASPTPPPERKEAIAIVGMSGRYPEARNLSEYWNNLLTGKNAIREIPPFRFAVSDYYDQRLGQKGKIYCKWLGALDEIEYFDPLFFHLSPAEAEIMDPQQRLFLEEGYKAFEDAGYSPDLLNDHKCGVYLGGISQEYSQLLAEQSPLEADLPGTSPAIAAARLAYHLNLKGPALAIDTACSSSLVAAHLACQALREQEIDMALVGGMSLCLTPGFYLKMCKAGILSPEGQCKTFDESADGFVPGEGVGALVLKRLADAEADHDQIYGVIIASGMNQDGATNGIMAPSVKSQIELEREIYEKYQIDPESISYVEMHGTGTKLGDPIELEALATVFGEKTQRKQYCAIGSVKTNIGHTLAAAGVASLHKVLLAMQHKKLVPSLHFEQPNPHFDFAASPFYVNTAAQDWHTGSAQGTGWEPAPSTPTAGTPLRAAVSSFGFSGTNAHIVIEEYLPEPDCRDADRGRRDRACPCPRPYEVPSLFVLSARSESQLRSYAQELKHWIEAHAEQALVDIAFTLQMGRTAMEHRLAILADSRELLLQKLERFVDGNGTSAGIYTDQVKKGINDAMLFEADADGQSLLRIWCQKRDLEKLAQIWVRGVNIDWNYLYPSCAGWYEDRDRPRRVSLPTYPFARERYWIPTVETAQDNDNHEGAPLRSLSAYTCSLPTESPIASSFPPLHPLVQRNISDFFEQRFSSTFRGEEFFLADHVVKGQRIMPAVAYLEMARAAVEAAMRGPGQQEGHILRLSRVVWVRPLVVSQRSVEVHIGLRLQEMQTVAFTISGQAAMTQDAAPVLVCEGQAELYAREEATQRLDLTTLQTRCQDQTLSIAACYQRYSEHGISYGPSYQGIEQLRRGESEVLARLRLPVAPGAQTRTDFVLHPSMLEAALQASIGLHKDQYENKELHLPFALDELEILGEIPAQGWAWVRQSSALQDTEQGWPLSAPTALKIDVEVCDDEGRVAVRLRGLSTRILREAPPLSTGQDSGIGGVSMSIEGGQAQGTVPTETNTLKLSPIWDWVILPQQPWEDTSAYQAVIVGGTPDERKAIAHLYPRVHTLEIPPGASIERLAQLLQELGVVTRRPIPDSTLQVFWLASHDPLLAPTQESILTAKSQGVLACFRLIKACLLLGYESLKMRWTVITRQAYMLNPTRTCNPTHAGLPGLCGALAKEFPHWRIQLLDLPTDAPLPMAEMLRLPADPQGRGWLYRNGRWYRQVLVPLNTISKTEGAYRRGGIYVVIGGAGGIGKVLSEYLIRKYQAQMIWIGRRKIDANIEASLSELAALGPRPLYIAADATDHRDLQLAYQQIKRKFDQIHGVVHSAIVLLDQSLMNMNEERFEAALAAKVDVSVRLAQIFEHEPLDFVLFFSSFNAFSRNAGQSNYAAGCTFEDAFAARLRLDWPCAVKVMNWGYWGDVGVVASSKYRELMAHAGLGSIEPAEAMEALEELLAGPMDQMALLKMTKPLAQLLSGGMHSVEAVACPCPCPPIDISNRALTCHSPNENLNSYPLAPVRIPAVQDTQVGPDLSLSTDTWEEVIQSEETVTIFPEQFPSTIPHLLVQSHLNQNGSREPADAQTWQGMQQMSKLLAQFLWSHLQSLGLFKEKQVVLPLLLEQAKISTSYDRWLQASIVYLMHWGYLRCEDKPAPDDYTVVDSTPIESATLWRLWDQQKEHWIRDADLKAQVVLVETTLQALPTILTGQRPGSEVLFPNGSMQLVEGIYQHNRIADYFNETLARQVVTYLQERLAHDRHARIRILEIGAGTGGTTNRVLQMLKPYQASVAEYCYSDISEAFLHYGEQRYEAAAYPFLTYRLFNVERPLAEQGIEPGRYDLVIATNVLHATSNIRLAVRNAKAVLKKHGLLLLNELTGTSIASLFSHLTFGLLPGWWVYQDPELRVPGGPALSAENWQAVLSSEGFGEVFFPHAQRTSTSEQEQAPDVRSVPHDQQVIVAESDGVVRQPSVQQAYRLLPAAAKGSVSSNDQASVPGQHTVHSLPIASSTDETLRQKSVSYIKELMTKVLKLPGAKINAAEPLVNYGLDSIMVLQLTNLLRETGMEQISSTLFFEYNTIDTLVEHFLQTQKEALEHLFGVNTSAGAVSVESAPDQLAAPRRDRGFPHPSRPYGTEKPLSVLTQNAFQRVPATSQRFLTEVQTKMKEDEAETTEEAIAIIGLAGRYPKAQDIQTFWHLLKTGQNAIGEIPASRWDWKRYFQTKKGIPGSMYTKWGGFLENIECFDAAFFHISPREAEQIDPQERLFLEVGYACIEDAGYTPTELQADGQVGVFVGVMNGNYPTGAAYWSIANRISFTLGLQGPSVAFDTACSSSLTALHFAVESLIRGTSTTALVGGVNLIVDPMHFVRLSQKEMLSANDQSKSFGENADGIVDSEGVGAILLKPLKLAETDRDHIYGVIKATAINHGGKTNGYTVPNPQAQARVIRQALQRARVDPRTISYIEAHGTGTVLGDPIEIAGLTRAFESYGVDASLAQGGSTRDTIPMGDKQWCAIGSVKSNIGHTESTAGIAGVTKVLLQMRYGQLAPSLHAETLNPHIDFSTTPFVVQQGLTEWKRPQMPDGKEVPRRAGISSFGAGGSNAHVILEEYVATQNVGATKAHPVLIVLSAHTAERLHERVQQLLSWMQEGEHIEEELDNLAYTLQVGREAMEERLAMQVSSLQELETKLRSYLADSSHQGGDWYRGQVKRYDAINLFAADEDGQKTVVAWMSKGKYGQLLEFWVKGGTIDWKHLYGAHPPRRISLPTYPFAREHYWLSIKRAPGVTSAIGNSHPSIIVGPGASPVPTIVQPVQATNKANGHGQASNMPHSIALRPLTGQGQALSLRDLEDGPGQDQSPPLVSLSDQPFSQSSRDADVAPEPSSEVSRASLSTTTHDQTALSTQVLVEELIRSLADALYMEPSNIDIDIPYIDMGLDSVIGVEWIQSINKQYALSLPASCLYDYPTIRQMASFLQKELLMQHQPAPVQSMLPLSLGDVLQQVEQKNLDPEKADQLLYQLFHS